MVENAKIQKFKCDTLSNFYTICHGKVYENQSKSLILQFCFNISSGFKNKALFFKLLLKSVF